LIDFYRGIFMNISKNYFIGIAAPALIAALAQPALAAADNAAPNAPPAIGAEEAGDGSAIIVTATKRAQNIQDVPVTLTAANGDLLAKLELRTAIDTARIAPNTNAWGTESRQRPRWFIRGIGSNDVSSNVVTPIAIYNDEIYLNHFSLQGFPLFDIDRVEILRGPGGTLWGKNTTGGAFSFVSRRPTDTPEGYVRLTYGNYDARVLEGAFGGPVTDRISARASFIYDRRDGFTTNDKTGKTVGGVEDFAARVQVKFEATDNLSILVNAHYRDFEGGNNAVYTVGTGVNGADAFGYISSTDRDHVSYNVDDGSQIQAQGGSINLNWDLGPATLTSISGIESADRSEITDGDKTPNEISRGYAATNVEQISQ
jgi:iron complex outermembrane receptor protein